LGLSKEMLYWALFRPGYLNSSGSNNVLYPFKEKHLWVKKATSLGVSEFSLRLMAWLCVRNDDCRNSQMVIVTGPKHRPSNQAHKENEEVIPR
jgi:hypothetical protein